MQAREVQAHLSALRSLCRGLLERVRSGPDPLGEEGNRKRKTGGVAPVVLGNGGGSWKERRLENRLRSLHGRDEIIAREERCVMCMVNVSRGGSILCFLVHEGGVHCCVFFFLCIRFFLFVHDVSG